MGVGRVIPTKASLAIWEELQDTLDLKAELVLYIGPIV